MTIAQKFVSGLVLMGVITTLTLPGRQTVPVLGAITNFGRGMFSTAMGTGKQV
jgi:hypothetical protein